MVLISCQAKEHATNFCSEIANTSKYYSLFQAWARTCCRISWSGQVFLLESVEMGEYKGWALSIKEVQPPADSNCLPTAFSTSPPDKLFQHCTIPTVRKVFLMSKVNFPWCNLSPLLLVVLMHMEHRLLLSSMQQLFMCLQAAVMTPLSLLFSKLNNLSNMYKGWFLKVLSSCCSCCFYSGDWEWKKFHRVDDQAVLSGALQIRIGMKGTNVFIAVYVHSCLHNKSVFTGPVTSLLTASPGQEQLH